KRRKGAGRAAAAPSSPSPLRGGIKGGGPATGAVPAARPPPPAGPRPLPWPFPLKSLHRSDLTLTGRSKAPQGGGMLASRPPLLAIRYSLFAIRYSPLPDCRLPLAQLIPAPATRAYPHPSASRSEIMTSGWGAEIGWGDGRIIPGSTSSAAGPRSWGQPLPLRPCEGRGKARDAR